MEESPMKSLLTLIVVLLSTLVVSGFAQTDSTGWQKTLDLNLNVTQNSYSDNWAGGEAGNVSWVSAANGLFEKQISPKFNSRNTIKLAFGQMHTQDKDTKKWLKPEKSTDKIDLESVLRITLIEIVDPYFAVRFESQFLDASVEKEKRYVNPVLLTFSAGVARKVWSRPEKDQLISRLGLAVRENIMRDVVYDTDGTILGIETNTATEGGIEWVTDFNVVLNEQIGIVTKLSTFKALFNSNKDDLQGMPEEDYWKAVDVNFENTISVSVAKYLQVQLYAQLLYDKEVDIAGRFKETLSLGLTYKMF
jgi:hypothetical protein